MKRSRWEVVALGYLGAVAGVVGAWAQFAPRSFYDSFPGLGHNWVAGDGPFNEHFIRDVGGLNLALLALTVAALLCAQNSAMQAVCGAAWIIVELPHIIYHGVHRARFQTGFDAFMSEAGLFIALTFAAAILDKSLRASQASAPVSKTF